MKITISLLVFLLFSNSSSAQDQGYRLQFDGVNDYVSVGPHFPTITDNFTMELWVYPTATRDSTIESNSGAVGPNQRYAIFPTHGDYYGANHAGAGISVGTNGVSVFEHGPSYLPSLLVFNTRITGWTHIAVVYTNKQPKLYINGILVRTGLVSTKIVHPSSDLGLMNYGYFQGLIDEVRIWNYSLTESQIIQNMSIHLIGTEYGLVNYFKLDEGTGLVANDASGHGNNGMLVNGPKWISSNDQILLILKTGYNELTGLLINPGQPDSSWTVIQDMDPTTTEPRPGNVVQSKPTWNTFSGTRWVSALAGISPDGPNGIYIYDYQFQINTLNQNSKLTFDLLADDAASVYLNGNFVDSTTGPTPYYQNSAYIECTEPSFFMNGTNTLRIVSYNINGDGTGIDVNGIITVSNLLNITSPIAGDIWPQGTNQKIIWLSTGISNVNIDLSTNNGANWTNIGENVPASLYAYDWFVNVNDTSQCKIRISNAATGTPNAISDVFTIIPTIPLENGDLVFNGYNYLLKWAEPDGPYKVVFYFCDSTSIYRPQGFDVGDSMVVQTTRNYHVLSNSELIPAKYYWRVYDNNWNPITAKKVFMRINLIPPSDPSNNPPMILVHGWNSNGTMWDTLETEVISLGYSPWRIEYPNEGDIRQSAWALSEVIDTVLSKSPGSNKVKILAHSMGGLVTRAYTVNMARNLLNESISYQGNIEHIAFLATPNRGGLFVAVRKWFAWLSEFFGSTNQYAIHQLDRSGEFMDSLNSHPLNPGISYLAIGGYDNSWFHYLISRSIPPERSNLLDAILSDIIRKWWASDGVVQLESAIGAPSGFFTQYKIVNRNHSNIYKNEYKYPISEIRDMLNDFFNDGIIESDNYENYLFRNLAGKAIKILSPNTLIQSEPIGGLEVHLTPEANGQPYITFSDKEGNFSFNFLPSGIYALSFLENGNVVDSGSVILTDSIVSATYNCFLEPDVFNGPYNCSVLINDGNPFVSSLQVVLKLRATGASQMLISEDPTFNNSIWLAYDTLYVFEFSDSNYGPKPVFVKFKDSGGIESNIVHNQIIYEQNLSATVQINSNIQYADVYIGSKLLNGRTPLSLTDVSPGEYVFSLSKSGYTAWPTTHPISIDSNQSYTISFTLVNSAPQPVKYFAGISHNDTLQLEWVAPSDADLMFTQINYRIDGVFPTDPTDGIIIVSQLSQPDEYYSSNISGLQPGVTYYLSAFAIDSAYNHSIPHTLPILMEPHSTFQLTVSINNGWNMVSIPGLLPTNQNVTSWWPGKDPAAGVFKFGTGYQAVTNAVPGTGYWMKNIGAQTYNTGDEWPAGGIQIVPHNPIQALSGWNMFAGYEQSVPTSGLTTTPPGLITGNVFKYASGYAVATQLDPGYGYWVKLIGAGSINIPAVGPAGPTKLVNNNLTDDFGKIIITDNQQKSYTLYAVNGKADLTQFDLPPNPPQGMFDVRYSSQRFAENIKTAQGIELQGVVYPVKLKAEGTGIIISDETGKEIARLKAGEEVTVNTAGKLYVSGNVIPLVYSLEQNYPNPFNPSTTIQFSIPEDVQNVKLIVYSALGEKIAELVNTGLTAGVYKYNWKAFNAASGLYIYQIVAKKFVATKKMILMK